MRSPIPGPDPRTGHVDKRALYVAKNFHPAHAGVIGALQLAGFDVGFVVHTSRSGDVKNGAGLVDVRTIEMHKNAVLTRLFSTGTSAQSFPSLRWCLRLLREERPELVLVYSHHASGVLIALLARMLGARVATVADKPRILRRRRDWPRLLLGRLIRPRAMLHTGTYGPPGRAVPLGPLLGRSFTAPYPVLVPDREANVGTRHTAAPSAKPGDPVRVLCMSCANPRRSRLTLPLEAIERAGLADRIELTFARQSHRDETSVIRARESELGLPESRILLDLSDQELRRLYSESFDLLVYPAERVDYGQTVGEALAYGLPAICGDSIGARILIEHGGNGYVYAARDADGLAEVLRLACDEGRVGLAEMGGRARSMATVTHSPEAWTRSLYRALDMAY